jgi:hypothetical protein
MEDDDELIWEDPGEEPVSELEWGAEDELPAEPEAEGAAKADTLKLEEDIIMRLLAEEEQKIRTARDSALRAVGVEPQAPKRKRAKKTPKPSVFGDPETAKRLTVALQEFRNITWSDKVIADVLGMPRSSLNNVAHGVSTLEGTVTQYNGFRDLLIGIRGSLDAIIARLEGRAEDGSDNEGAWDDPDGSA